MDILETYPTFGAAIVLMNRSIKAGCTTPKIRSSRIRLIDDLHSRYDLNTPVGVDFQIDLIPVSQSTFPGVNRLKFDASCVNGAKVLYGSLKNESVHFFVEIENGSPL